MPLAVTLAQELKSHAVGRSCAAEGFMQTCSAVNGNTDGRIRWATRADVPAIARLLRRAYADDKRPRISDAELEDVMARGELIVLAVQPGEVLAAACLATARGHGRLTFIVTAPGIPGLDARMRGVAAALEEAALRHAS
jgi:hypothetical protein